MHTLSTTQLLDSGLLEPLAIWSRDATSVSRIEARHVSTNVTSSRRSKYFHSEGRFHRGTYGRLPEVPNMRIVVDLPVSRAAPGLAELAVGSHSSPSYGIFDEHVSRGRLVATVARIRPELVVVDPSWLPISALLRRALDEGGCPATRCVLGSSGVSDALKIRAVRHGFVDIVDIEQPADRVVDHVREIFDGRTRLEGDRLWGHVTRLPPAPDVAAAPADSLDREIADLLAIGLSDREIAEGVHLSLQAVRNRVSAMLERSGCANRTQLGWLHSSRQWVERLMFDGGPDGSARDAAT